MAKIGLLLSGCGVFDGAEIHEAVFSLLALTEAGVEVQMMAPDINQYHVINHAAGAPSEGETRNVLVEAARIARGSITSLDQVDLGQLDGLVVPGGFGVAKNFCTFAFEGPECSVDPGVEQFLKTASEQGLPLGFACIAPALAAKVFGAGQLTIGSAEDPTADGINALGAEHVACTASEVVIDHERKVVSTPAYMLDAPLTDIRAGLKRMVDQVVEWSSSADTQGALSELNGWSIVGGALYKRWSTDSFLAASKLVNQIGDLAEEANHHPDLTLGWGYVSVSLTTHDQGGLSSKDFTLAKAIDQIG